jgi:hypothetical protein
MAALLNELLEEAVAQCLAFAEHADSMHEATGTCGDKVKALGEKVRDEAAETHGLFADLAAKLKEAEHDLGNAESKAEGELGGLRSRISEVESRVAGLVSAVKSAATELHEGKTSVTHELESHQHEIDEHFNNNLQKVHALQEDIGHRLQTVHDAVSALQHAVDEAQHSLTNTTASFFQKLDHFTTHADEQLQAYMTALHEHVDTAAQTLDTAANEIITKHNTVMEALREEFHNKAPREAETTFAQVKEAVEQLVGLCHQKEGALAQSATEIAQKVQEVVGLAQHLEPPLAEAARLK